MANGSVESAHTPTRIQVRPRDLARYLGPAFLVSVGYIDPGNWATNIAAGSDFNYSLLWVILLSNVIAIILQSLSAKLGLASGKNLAELCRERFSPATVVSFWIVMEIAMMATDIAEFLGAALGFNILFGISMPVAALLTVVAVYLILGVERFGFRKIEYTIIGLVSIVGLCYVIELMMTKPDAGALVTGLVIPSLPGGSLFVAVGILGATVMPHNLFLHSEIIKTRLGMMRTHGWTLRHVVRFAFVDCLVALNISFLINAAMIVMAAAVFFSHGIPVHSIEQAHETLSPLLGKLSGGAFAIALLASGLSSSVTATMSGQIVMGGLMKFNISLWWRRTITIFPALIVIFLGLDTLKILILSQVTLSIALPFACIPLLLFTSQKKLMNEFKNSRAMAVLGGTVIAVIIYLNILLIMQLL
ncbi:MAG TPA: Nramp family divalent metal transporter [Candidatus Kapabacteria bacterium]|nr:Nramp family divalent metal transporter [Candidatus Kapabacteria bacterium]